MTSLGDDVLAILQEETRSAIYDVNSTPTPYRVGGFAIRLHSRIESVIRVFSYLQRMGNPQMVSRKVEVDEYLAKLGDLYDEVGRWDL